MVCDAPLGRGLGVKHLSNISPWPALAAADEADLSFVIATLQFGLTILQALQTKKISQQT